MNERIKELLYQAGGQYGGEHFATGQNVIYTDEVDYENFAELIIRECCNIVNNLEGVHNPGDCSTVEYIKEHFGVTQ